MHAPVNRLALLRTVMTRSAARAANPPSPGTARALRGGRALGWTPVLQRKPEPLTLQDFLREVDIQFLDHMRRGASINLADLASDPPPATLQASRVPTHSCGSPSRPRSACSVLLRRAI